MLDHPPANNKVEIFAPLDIAVDALALCMLCLGNAQHLQQLF